mmetsp:Transcript_1064/g.1974  ORF Transcript_1064/g.1974 Transcript_1064/m.1974 type:complete len:103 (+) Transcript_1064:71-379(+)
MIDESNFRPTPQFPIIHHFVCKICKGIVRDPLQCSNTNCAVLLCRACINAKVPWSCSECKNKVKPSKIHRKVKDFMSQLQFLCPGCSEELLFDKAYDHVDNC